MKALVDADMIRYALAFACQKKEEDGTITVADEGSWKHSVNMFIKSVMKNSGATGYPLLYLTGKGNFREKIAKKKVYKGSRKEEKPLLYNDITTYLIDSWGAQVVEGMEADDAMAIEQTSDRVATWKGAMGLELEEKDALTCGTIICTNDKDLRMVPGWHYSWPVGEHIGEKEPYFVQGKGEIVPKYHKTKTYKDGSPQLVRCDCTGYSLFYYQLIVGDSVDNIPGVPRAGPRKAYETLNTLDTELEMYKAVYELYEEKYPENALEELLEQAYLLWMVRELDKEGNPVMWVPPIGE